MAALLVGMSVMAVMFAVALPVWQTAMQREREAELVFRGEQYVQAIRLFQRRYAGTFPPNVDVLVQQRFLRRRYLDPITKSDFQLLYAGPGTGGLGARIGGRGPSGPGPGAKLVNAPLERGVQATAFAGRGGVVGVVSTSTQTSLRLYYGRGRYNEWTFVATGVTPRAGAPGGALETEAQGPGSRPGTGRLMPLRPPPALAPPLPRR